MEKKRGLAWPQWGIPRKHPRVPLVARLEKLAGGKTTAGRTGDISLGGILVLSGDTLEPLSEVRVRFDLPSGHHVDVQGEVVYSTPGVRMGIRFLHLSEDDQKAISEYAEQIKPYKRRTARLARRLLVALRWQDYDGNWHEEPAETVLLSKYGCMVLTPVRMKIGESAFVRWPEAGREAEARIVFRKLGGAGSPSEMGFEFLDTDNFWGIEFPPETPLWELPAR